MVSLSEAEDNPTILYTTDGSTPTNTSSLFYVGPIQVSTSQTIQAFAFSGSYASSPIATATYVISASVPAPTFSPAAGTYSSAQSVSIADAVSGASIYYTSDGSTPTTSSARIVQ